MDHAGASAGKCAGGTAFLVHVPLSRSPSLGVIFAVTNSHVVHAGASFARINTQNEGSDILEIDERNWIHHPDGHDLAIVPIGLGHQFKYKSLSLDGFLTFDLISTFRIFCAVDAIG
jgi:hypothetical protein